MSSVASLGSSCIFLFILICCVRGSPNHLVSVLPLCDFIYKAGRKTVSRRLGQVAAAAGVELDFIPGVLTVVVSIY
jgi:hypothetical protein